jgi:N-acetylmuramoyl-L-alanine amidase
MASLTPPNITSTVTEAVTEAVASPTSLGGVVGSAADSVTNVFGQVVDGINAAVELGQGAVDQVNVAIDDVVTAGSDLINEGLRFVTEIQERAGSGLSGVLQNILETNDGNLSSVTKAVTVTPVPPATQAEINLALENENLIEAVALTVPYATTPDATPEQAEDAAKTILEAYSLLSWTVSGTLIVDASSAVFPSPYLIKDNESKWSGANSPDYKFSYINSTEELVAEFSALDRDVREMVVHWTDSFTNKNLSAEDIDAYDTALGNDGIVYHLVIRRDGSLQRGCPLAVASNHTDSTRAVGTIGVIFVGGFNVPSNTTSPGADKSVASLTRHQFNTFDILTNAFYSKYPGGQVIGHNDIDTTSDDPGFDVREYCLSRFNKISLYYDPAVGTITASEINSPSDILFDDQVYPDSTLTGLNK